MHNRECVANTVYELLSEFFARYGYWAVFFGVMLENAGIPLPGETVLLFAGFLAYQGKINLAGAISVAIMGAAIGDSLGFLVGRYGGVAFINRYLRRIGFVARRYDRAQRLFLKYGPWAVFTARFITGLRVFAGILAGAFRMSYLRFLLFNFTGAVCWALAIGSVGFILGSNWQRLVDFVGKLDEVTLAAVLGLILAAMIIRAILRRHGRVGDKKEPEL